MLIELVVVAAILLYLNAAGILDFSSPYAVAFSIAISVVAIGVGSLVTHMFARGIINSLFGISAWSPRPDTESAADARLRARKAAAGLEELKTLAAERPRDKDISRRLADAYLQAGQPDDAIRERERLIGTGALSAEEVCHAYNRMADLELSRDRTVEAMVFLERIVELYPGSAEARNAKARLHRLRDDSALPGGLDS